MNDYPANWDEIATQVKERAGWKCIRCGHAHEFETGYVLTVHHLDGDKANCRWWNLVALCQRCHLHIQARVDMRRMYMFEHSTWFIPYVAGYYAYLSGYEITRTQAEQTGSFIIQAYLNGSIHILFGKSAKEISKISEELEDEQ